MTSQETVKSLVIPPSEEQELLLAMEEVSYSTSSDPKELPYSIELPVVHVIYEADGTLVQARLEPTEVEKAGYFLAGKFRGGEGTSIIGPSITAQHLKFRKEAVKGKKEEWIEIDDAHIYPIKIAETGLRIAIKGRS